MSRELPLLEAQIHVLQKPPSAPRYVRFRLQPIENRRLRSEVDHDSARQGVLVKPGPPQGRNRRGYAGGLRVARGSIDRLRLRR